MSCADAGAPAKPPVMPSAHATPTAILRRWNVMLVSPRNVAIRMSLDALVAHLPGTLP
jgi:hypothetical protein